MGNTGHGYSIIIMRGTNVLAAMIGYQSRLLARIVCLPSDYVALFKTAPSWLVVISVDNSTASKFGDSATVDIPQSRGVIEGVLDL